MPRNPPSDHSDSPSAQLILAARALRERSYQDYIAAFNNRDLVAVRSFLSADFTFDRGEWPPLCSPDEFVQFYEKAWSHFDERIRPLATVWEGDLLIVHLEVALSITRTWTDFPGGPLLCGDAYTVQDRLTYRFDETDRILTIVALPAAN